MHEGIIPPFCRSRAGWGAGVYFRRSACGRLSQRYVRGSTLGGLTVCLVAAAAPAHAIPSPDLAVNFFSNAAQLVGLLSALGGAVIFGGASRFRNKTDARRGRRTVGWAAGVIAVLLLVSLSANILQWVSAEDERNQRLQTNLVRSSTENGKRVGDVSLKTLAFSDQIGHPLAMSNEELGRLLAGPLPDDVNLIDVREPEEREVGKLAGFGHVRFPDLLRMRDALDMPGKRNVLLCYSGNRSAELCSTLAEQGISCNFVVGGYEKWVSDGLAVSSVAGNAPAVARGLPGYRNSATLLDTDAVTTLVRDEGALFIDVRYPGDFALSHLPGAINLPIRKMPSTDLQAALEALPDRPVVAPCYDRRSCFYGEILGLRLDRLGRDFRGRYTVPHEYVAPGSRAEAALAGGSPSLLGAAFDATTEATSAVLAWLDSALGSFSAALLALVLLFRVVAAPFTLKTERDQVVMRGLDSEVEELRTRWRTSPRRYARELRALYRSNGLSPAVNMAGVLVQLPLFVVLFAAVDAYAAGHSGTFLWYDAAARPDPHYLLPALIGTFAFIQLWISAKRKTARVNAVRGVACLGLAALTVPLAAAVNLYLTASLALMLAQGMVVRWVMSRQESAGQRAAVLTLDRADGSPDAGNKAARLARMLRAGLPVPPGFVVLPAARLGGAERARDRRRVDRLWRRYALDRVAVRSSGANEDGGARSYAGVFDTILGVERAGLLDAISQVRASLANGRARHYGEDGEKGAVVVQAMVSAEYAGVLFTRHPARAEAVMVELIAGLGDRLVDGTATPETYTFGRFSGRSLDSAASPVDLAPLLALGRRLERVFGGPQDIEWCYADGAFHLLQSRDITALSTVRTPVEREQDRLAALVGDSEPTETVLVQNDYAELMPRATPVSLSLMERLWMPGGSVERACQALGVPYDAEGDSPYLVTVLGRLYVNTTEHERRFARSVGAFASFRLARDADAIGARFRTKFLPAFEDRMRILEAIDPGRLDTGALQAVLRDTVEQFVQQDYVEAEIVNIAAQQYVSMACRKLERLGLAAAVYLAGTTDTVVQRGLWLLARTAAGEKGAHEAFIKDFGHRATHDYELSEPRYAELAPAEFPVVPHVPRQRTDDARLPIDNRLAAAALDRALRYQALKEEAKHHCLRELAVIRRLLLEVDLRFGLDGSVFYLDLDEIFALSEDSAKRAAEVARARAQDLVTFQHLPDPPVNFTPADIETLGSGSFASPATSAGAVAGTVVAGRPPVEGLARIIRGEDLEAVQSGEILVVRSLTPDLVQVYGVVAGVVAEVGGWLSHAAILAREYDLPTLVGASGAATAIRDGDHIRLDADGSVEILVNAVAAE